MTEIESNRADPATVGRTEKFQADEDLCLSFSAGSCMGSDLEVVEMGTLVTE